MPASLPDFDGLIDWNGLQQWLETVEAPGSGPVSAVEQLTGGTQNNLFLLTRGAERLVLRRPPRHPRANSNDTMLREARVLRALAGSDVPHPRFYAACADPTVIGACFYLMAPLDGFSPRGPLPGRYATDKNWRREFSLEFVRAAAALARVDPVAVGLADFGKAQDWHARQVDRWRGQLESYAQLPGYRGSSLPHVDAVGHWLKNNLPANRRIGIIHGDLHFSNAMFQYDTPKIAGLIDWELSTLGDPLLDAGWMLSRWLENGDPPGLPPFVTPWDNFMSRGDMMRLYGELTGRDMTGADWYFVLACYKQGCILEGTYARAQSGQADAATGQRLHATAIWLLEKARQVIGAN